MDQLHADIYIIGAGFAGLGAAACRRSPSA
jgi:cation diffusion facilitator CzcD-associated flavoprotein CzcO